MVRRRLHGEQLALPLAEATPTATTLPVDDLLALHHAMRLLVRVADGAVSPSSRAIEEVHGALAFLATRHLSGRLGHLVRRYHGQSPAQLRWAELVEEFAFVLSLVPLSGSTASATVKGGPG